MKRFRRLKLVTVVAVILIPAIIVFSGYPETDTADIEWEIEGCDISVTASDVDFGTVSISVPGSIDTESDYSGQPEAVVESSCDYTLSVEATSFDLPSGHPDPDTEAITDFWVKGGDIGSYNSFDGLGSDHSKTVDSSGSAPGATYAMDYKYTFDYNDIAGDYKVVLTYTASTS